MISTTVPGGTSKRAPSNFNPILVSAPAPSPASASRVSPGSSGTKRTAPDASTVGGTVMIAAFAVGLYGLFSLIWMAGDSFAQNLHALGLVL